VIPPDDESSLVGEPSSGLGSQTDTGRDADVHAFLIADVRGYTQFTQERGDEEAGRLAGRFAQLTRSVVEAHRGKVLELSHMLKRLLILSLALGAAGCGNVATNESSASPTGGTGYVKSGLQDDPVDPNAGFDEVTPDWDNPIGGSPVANAADAAPAVSFELQTPTGLGETSAVYVSSEEISKDAAGVAFVYDTVEFGRVIVIEHPPESSPSEYQEFHEYLVSINGDPLVHGRFDLVKIRDGVEALVTTSEDGRRSVAFWLENGVEFIIEGPTLTFDQVISIAELV
jgi:class 3 adenylate cyclase